MKKEYCIYCGEIAETKDHVPPKCFLDKPYPILKTVPACFQCNNAFSLNEQLVMYMTDYLLSIEFYDGNFTREKARSAFAHRDNLEDRMISSLKVDENRVVYFDFEDSRIVAVIDKIAKGILYLTFGIKKEIVVSNFIGVTQLSPADIKELLNFSWNIIQEHRFQYYISNDIVYFVINDILLCLVQFSNECST